YFTLFKRYLSVLSRYLSRGGPASFFRIAYSFCIRFPSAAYARKVDLKHPSPQSLCFASRNSSIESMTRLRASTTARFSAARLAAPSMPATISLARTGSLGPVLRLSASVLRLSASVGVGEGFSALAADDRGSFPEVPLHPASKVSASRSGNSVLIGDVISSI